MGAEVWATVTMSIALVFAGAVAWWIGQDCALTITGASGAVLAGAVAVVALAVSADPTSAMSVSLTIIAVGGVWLLGFATAGGIRWQRRMRPRVQRTSVAVDERVSDAETPGAGRAAAPSRSA